MASAEVASLQADAAAAVAMSFFEDDDPADVLDDDDSGLGKRPTMCRSLFLYDTDDSNTEAKDMVRSKLTDGPGEFLYILGNAEVDADKGFTEAELAIVVQNFLRVVSECEASATELRRKDVEGRTTVEYLVRRQAEENDFMEIRVAVVGNVDAGKSTMLGVLTHGELDNGRGLARQRLFRHKHEQETGRTSSVGNDILGFDSTGSVVNKPQTHGSGVNWERICRQSSKVITFIDLAGHERYLKTTVFGMTGHAPDFCMLMIGSNAGVIGMTKEHLGLALALNVPVFVVVTKIDMCPTGVLQDTLKLLTRILRSPGCRKIPLLVNNKDDVVLAATNFVSERMCPVFQVSNVTGQNLDLLKSFLNLLSTRLQYRQSDPAEYQIDDNYSVPGVGTVVAGTMLRGCVRSNDSLLLGPDPLGRFQLCTIKSIHRKRMPVSEAHGGQTATFALKKVRRSQVRKGMVMVAPSLKPSACWEFEGEILVLHHPTTISKNYQAMVHCGSVRQTASILSMTKSNLRTGDKAMCHFRFIKSPEFLRPDARLVFREGRTKAVGHVIRVFPHEPIQPTTRAGRSKASKEQRDEQKAAHAAAQTSTTSAAAAVETGTAASTTAGSAVAEGPGATDGAATASAGDPASAAADAAAVASADGDELTSALAEMTVAGGVPSVKGGRTRRKRNPRPKPSRES